MKIAVITAPNPGHVNPGMLTVDLAFDAVMRRLPMADTDRAPQVSWFTHVTPDSVESRGYVDTHALPFSFRPLAENLTEVHDHDRIVFWGDFLHAHNFHLLDVATQSRRFKIPLDAAASYLFRDAPDEVLSRTILFGGSRVCDEPAVLDVPEYADPLRRLVRGARGVWARERETAATYADMRGVDATQCLGMDAAFLLTPTQGETNTIGIFVGNRTEIPSGFIRFCRLMARELDAQPRWIQWLRFPRRRARYWRRFITRWALAKHGDQSKPGQTGFEEMVDRLAAHRLVISDTYHLCVNAWRQGTPAICLSAAEPSRSGERTTLNQRKKVLMHEMIGAPDFTFQIPRRGITDPRAAAERFAAAMSRAPAIIRNIRDGSLAAEAALVQALDVV